MIALKGGIRLTLRALTLARRPLALLLVTAACTATAYAGGPLPSPEVDPGSLASALTLLTGGVLLLTDRLRRK
jgi:hypothetical protein